MTGIWNLILKSPVGKIRGTVDVVEENGVLTGTMTADGNDTPTAIKDGVIKDGEYTMVVEMNTPFGMTDIKLVGKVDGDTTTGKAHAKMLSMMYEGTRQ